MARRHRGLAALAVCVVAVWAANSSTLAPVSGPARVLAHRGVHQTFSGEGVGRDTCTATRIGPVTHGFIENTLPSLRAAFDAGAGMVEFDLHGTSDGHLIVFHDAGLDCRTNGAGRPEDQPLAALRALDLGFGYTSDGVTFPLRGTGVGLLVTLPEVLTALPGRPLLLHLKTGRPEDGDRLADILGALPNEDRARHIVYGELAPLARVQERAPDVRTFDKPRLKRCLGEYVALGWSGWVPSACANTLVLIPRGYESWVWGFPRRFEARMRSVGTDVALAGPLVDGNSTGIDDAASLARVPEDFGGWIWTNRVEAIAIPIRASEVRP